MDVSHEAIRIDVCSTAARAACPDCGSESTRVHSSYLRFPTDVPSGGRLVVLQLRVRRFFCTESSCARRTFAEQMSGLTRRHSRWTERLRSTLAAVGLALAGRAGARMARAFGVPISRSAVLRLLDALPEPEVPAPRVVGVDEYATRKGRVYGTVLVDVETRRPVDLLPDREASSLAAWLAKRPGIEIVCRDRAPFFAEGATAGAPQATQVADRWHLWHNLGEAAERAVARHRQCLRVLIPDREGKAEPPTPPEDKADSPWRSERFANRVRARHATVHALLEAGHSRRSIGRQLNMTHRTVKSLADAAKPEDLFRGQWQYNRTSVLDEYKPYLDERWDEGCTNASKLWEEIVPLGYRGSYGRVSAYLREKRTSPRPVTAQPPAPRGFRRPGRSECGSGMCRKPVRPAARRAAPRTGRRRRLRGRGRRRRSRRGLPARSEQVGGVVFAQGVDLGHVPSVGACLGPGPPISSGPPTLRPCAGVRSVRCPGGGRVRVRAAAWSCHGPGSV
ncbi:ISL3 family transposase [Streptomyces lavendulae]|uniref:ISL3 family transposase n=1 Tax=Streptomyces lavendulae TaxID=1914 RepID=UPI0033283141